MPRSRAKEPDHIGLLTEKEAVAEYQRRFGLPPMEDPPTVWANMACWMADDARAAVAYLSALDGLNKLRPNRREIRPPHVPPPAERRLEILDVPLAVDVVYSWRRRGLMFQVDEHLDAIVDIQVQLIEYERTLKELGLINERGGRPAEWGLDAFAFTMPFLWTRHGTRPSLTNEIVALAARALRIGDPEDPNPIDYWRKRRRRLVSTDPDAPRVGPEAGLIRCIQRQYGSGWEARLRELLAQGVRRGGGAPGRDPSGGGDQGGTV